MILTSTFWLEPVVLIIAALIFLAGMALGSYLTRYK